MKLFKSIAVTAVAAIIVTVAPAVARAGTYTLPNGQKITTSAPKHVVTSRPHATQATTTASASKAPRPVQRTTRDEFRSTHPTQVKVRRGDTLWGIAAKTRGSGHEWRKIAHMNGVKGTTIYVGQTLRVR